MAKHIKIYYNNEFEYWVFDNHSFSAALLLLIFKINNELVHQSF